MKKILLISLLTITITGCSEFAILMSGSSLAVSQNTYVKAYNAVDFGVVSPPRKELNNTLMKTERNTFMNKHSES